MSEVSLYRLFSGSCFEIDALRIRVWGFVFKDEVECLRVWVETFERNAGA